MCMIRTMHHLLRFFVWVSVVTIIVAPASAEPAEQPEQRSSLLLVVEEQQPRVTISWTAGGEPQHYTMTMPFTAPVGGEQLGDSNARAYATMGGTRIETGAGHPKGAVIRVGLTKADSAKAFFRGIDPGTSIELSITGVRFNQPVKYHEGSALMHLKYSIADLEACALPGDARNQYLMSSPDDTLGGRVKRGVNATPGALDGKPGHGSVEVIVQPDDPTLVDMHVRLPYAMLRHLQDPWVSDLPGTFFEPIHFHAEAEMIPIDAAPLVRDPIIPERNESVEDAEETDQG